MITHVPQRQLYRGPDHPDGPQIGDCMRACVASIFGITYEEAEGIEPEGRSVSQWLLAHHPGVTFRDRSFQDYKVQSTLNSYKDWPTVHSEYGYWIASIWSPRIPDVESFGCGCVERVPGGDPECEWCRGRPQERSMGVRWGLHAVVMHHDKLEWDPHPEATGKIEHFEGAMTFTVSDPSQLR